MPIRRLLKYVPAGIGLQILFLFLAAMTGLGKVSTAAYWPWILLGNSTGPSGASGHAMPGGAILGFLLGMFVYSLLIGAGIYYLRNLNSGESL
ncbi:MAG TPA: hypothetical protein VMZ26_04375 [Pyrinomonadaceae bacterium]|nr:hypothetical protein [Pyrinomonadaceae bacterium]